MRKDFAEQYGVTRPYYLYRLALMVRRENAGIANWDDLKKDRKAVGVLGGTSAHRQLEVFAVVAIAMCEQAAGQDARDLRIMSCLKHLK